MTRLRLPPGLRLAAGIYDVVVGYTMEERYIAVRDAHGLLDYTPDWYELRDGCRVEIECARHPGRWWSTTGKNIAASEVENWRCPDCAWAFRQGFASRGGWPKA